MTPPTPDLPATLTAPARGLLATLDARAGEVTFIWHQTSVRTKCTPWP